MTTFEIPTVTTERSRLRAFHQSDLAAYSAMQANPEVMRYMVMGRTSTPAEEASECGDVTMPLGASVAGRPVLISNAIPVSSRAVLQFRVRPGRGGSRQAALSSLLRSMASLRCEVSCKENCASGAT